MEFSTPKSIHPPHRTPEPSPMIKPPESERLTVHIPKNRPSLTQVLSVLIHVSEVASTVNLI